LTPRIARGRVLVALLAALLLTSCGYIGDPLPPLANVPLRVGDLAAIQRGGRIIAHFTVPLRTTEGFPIPRPLTLDLRIGAGTEQFEENQWASRARHIPAPVVSGPLATYEIPAAEWTGKEVVLGVRITAANGKQSGWSNWAIVPVIAAPETPQSVTAISTAQGVQVSWRAPGAAFRVLRKTGAAAYATVAEVESSPWTDTATEYGKPYTYIVQTIAKLNGSKQAESDLSEEATVVPEDKFAPAVPAGLRADAVTASIELAWDRNTEPDLAGYRIYRAVGDGPLEKVADTSQVPTYSDRAVEHGKTYRYSISAVDRVGNESARSAPVAAQY
jgi:hypothetical protein